MTTQTGRLRGALLADTITASDRGGAFGERGQSAQAQLGRGVPAVVPWAPDELLAFYDFPAAP